jgi:hypothetical protein
MTVENNLVCKFPLKLMCFKFPTVLLTLEGFTHVKTNSNLVPERPFDMMYKDSA